MIRLENLLLRAGEFELEIPDLQLSEGEYFVLLGPTGSGKTVLLEAIAGLGHQCRGSIYLGSADVSQWPPEKRGAGFVYQDYLLFPHLSVSDNIGFGLRGMPGGERTRRVREMAELLRIEGLLGRSARGLSGGEQQRVALARALVARPRVLLLDEPLSALDSETRELLQSELRRLHQALRPTVLHVTHNSVEAMALADRVGVLGEGRLQQVGSPLEVFRQPTNSFVARFVGCRNVFSGVARGQSVQVLASEGRADVGPVLRIDGEWWGRCTVVVRPEEIRLSPEEPGGAEGNCLSGIVEEATVAGAWAEVKVNVAPAFVAFLTRPDLERLAIKPGERVWLSFLSSSVHLCRH